jgi:hypothetical protein
MHVPTGLFIQGHYNAADFGGNVIGAASGYWGETTVFKKPADQWLIQAGISKNWFGYGATSVYGEYGAANDWGADFGNATNTTQGRNFAAPANTTGFTAVNGVIGTEARVWGMGIVQRVDAAATDIYLGYRHFDTDIHCNAADVGVNVCAGAATAVGTAAATKTLPTEGIDVIVMGARMQF